MIEVQHIKRTFADKAGTFEVLKDISFSVNRGEMIALLGISGSGKTTLLQILGGLDRPTGGEVVVEGKRLSTLSSAELAAFRSRKIGFVFQFHHLLPDFTAFENVLIPGMIAGQGRAACEKRSRELLAVFGLERIMSHYPTELSGGELQRVALARALFNDPAIVLADEPTGNLDRKNGEHLLEFFHRANRELNQTFIVATHNSQLTGGMHRIITIDDGLIAAESGSQDSVS
jgi:lipoprotein-releasing system ATP-binding protein